MKTGSTGLRLSLWLGIGMLAFASWAHAAAPVRCTFTPAPPAMSTFYGSLLHVVAGSFTVDCTKPSSAAYYVSATGTNTPAYRAVSGGNALVYGLFQDAGCSIPWNNTTGLISKAVVSPSANNHVYYVCIPANQNVPAGTYQDTINVAFTASSTANPQGASTFNDVASFQVSIVAPASCTMTASPGSVTFNYTSFSAANVLANTSFATTCNSGLPYTVEFNTPGGTIAGVNYALALNTSPNTGGATLISSTGTGAAQTFYINGEIAAGQSGTCGGPTCAGSNPHTVIITY